MAVIQNNLKNTQVGVVQNLYTDTIQDLYTCAHYCNAIPKVEEAIQSYDIQYNTIQYV